MSLLFIDSFDDRTANWGNKYTSSGGTLVGAGAARTGNGVSISGNGHLTMTFTARSTFIMGAAIKPNTLTLAVKLMEFLDGGTSQIFVQQNAGSTLSVVRGDGTVLGTTASSTLLSTSVFHYMEFTATIHNTAGSYNLVIDGVSVLSNSGVNTRNSANNQATDVRIEWTNAGNAVAFDDYYICDTAGTVNNSFLGPIKIECKFPTGTGTTTQLAPTGIANNWDAVNDATPDDDTTYVASATPGQEDTYVLADMTATAGTIVGVQTGLRARKDDAAVRQIASVARIAGTEFAGPTLTMTTSYANFYQLQETSPATANPWGISEINGMEIGVRIIA